MRKEYVHAYKKYLKGKTCYIELEYLYISCVLQVDRENGYQNGI